MRKLDLLVIISIALASTPQKTNAQVPANAQCAPISATRERCFFQPASPTADEFTPSGNQCNAFLTGATLAVITSQTQQDALETYVASIGFSTTTRYWIGFTDIATEGIWLWVDGSSSAFQNWLPGQPTLSGNQDCAWSRIFDSNQWRQQRCNRVYQPMCSFDQDLPSGSTVPFTTPGPLPPPNDAACLYVSATQQKCFYMPDTGTLSWEAANVQCSYYDATLASIVSLDELNLVISYVDTKGITGDYYIGANDKDSEFTWVWVDGSVFDFAYWSTGYPRTSNNNDCVYARPSVTHRWLDRSCTNGARDYLCAQYFDVPPESTLGVFTTTPVPPVDDALCLYISTLEQKCFFRPPGGNLVWTDAVQNCKVYSAELASINSQAEQDKVIEYVTAAGITAQYWIGLNDRDTETVFVWEDGSPFGVFSYNNWDGAYPRQSNSNDCVYGHSTINHKWRDRSCTSSRNYICAQIWPVPPESTLASFTTTPRPIPGGEPVCVQLAPFQRKCYYFASDANNQNWDAANTFCLGFGGSLASITSQAEQDAATQYIVNAGLLSTDRYWIGLNDIDIEATFVWNDGSPLTYTNWDTPTYPRTSNANDCIFSRISANHEWQDRSCTQTEYGLCSRIENIIPPVPDPIEYCIELAPLVTKCYFWSSSQDVEEWQTANGTCKADGGLLATINTAEQQDAVIEFIRLANTTFDFWIGYNKLDDGTNYQWPDGSIQTYTNWSASYPVATQFTDCVSASGFSTPQAQWKNIVCITRLYALCSRTAVFTTSTSTTTTPAPTTTTTPGPTPSPFPFCFHNHRPDNTPGQQRCYYWLPGPYNWSGAVAACNETGGSLITMPYPSDHFYLYEYTQNNSITEPFWIGLHDIGYLAYWIWVDQTPHIFSHWAPNFPTIDVNKTKTCAYTDPTENFRWKNQNCTSNLLPAICSTYENNNPPQKSGITGVAVVTYGEGYRELFFKILYNIALVGQQDPDDFFRHPPP